MLACPAVIYVDCKVVVNTFNTPVNDDFLVDGPLPHWWAFIAELGRLKRGLARWMSSQMAADRNTTKREELISKGLLSWHPIWGNDRADELASQGP